MRYYEIDLKLMSTKDLLSWYNRCERATASHPYSTGGDNDAYFANEEDSRHIAFELHTRGVNVPPYK